MNQKVAEFLYYLALLIGLIAVAVLIYGIITSF